MANKRKVFLINKDFQFSIIRWFSVLAFILVGIYYLSMHLFFDSITKEAIAAGLAPDHVFFVYINEQKRFMVNVFLITSLIAILVIFIGGLLLSHKVAGPIYRLVQHLSTHNKDSVPPLKFRKGDYFPEVEAAFNDFIKK